MEVTRSFAGTRHRYQGTVGLLPTLGFFHEGHLKLMDFLRARCDTLVVSLFVNPTQFNVASDFDAYPRDEERDARLAFDHGADLLFAPPLEEVYQGVSVTTVEVTGGNRRNGGTSSARALCRGCHRCRQALRRASARSGHVREKGCSTVGRPSGNVSTISGSRST